MKSYQNVTSVSPLLILAIKGITTHLWIYKTQLESPFPEITTPILSCLLKPGAQVIQWDPQKMRALTPKQALLNAERNLSAKACCPSLIWWF